jgi:hypothetical protein
LLERKIFVPAKLKKSGVLPEFEGARRAISGMFLEFVNLSRFRDSEGTFSCPRARFEILLESGSWSVNLPVLGARKKKVQLLRKRPKHNM